MMPSTKAPRAGLVNWQSKRSNSPFKSTPPQGPGYKVATEMPAMSSITATAAEKVRLTYACNDVRFIRKDRPEVWITPDKITDQMFVGYPFVSYIPGAQGAGEPTRYGDFIIDIDTGRLACPEAVKIIEWFEQVYGIEANQWRIYLSGKKGVHLELPAEILGLEVGHPLLTPGYKRLAKDIEGELQIKLDTSMYNMGLPKPYRQPNIMRDTGTCKRQIDFDTLLEIVDEDEYREACKEPGPVWRVENTARNEMLAGKLQQYLADAEKHQEGIKSAPKLTEDEIDRLAQNIPPCISALATLTTATKGSTFNDIAMQLTAYAVTAGFTEDQFLAGCKPFIENYPSTSLDTIPKRYDNCRARYRTMAANGNAHSCGGVLALRIPGFDCKKCRMKKAVPGQESSQKASEPSIRATTETKAKNIITTENHKSGTGEGGKAILEAGTVAIVATVAVANPVLQRNIVGCDLDLEPEDIQRLRGALEVISSSAQFGRHASSQIIGWGLRHTESAIQTHVGTSLAAEWDERTGGNSTEIFNTSDPNYAHTQPATTASIYALAKECGWTGQIPWSDPDPLITRQQADQYPLDALPGRIGAAVAEVVRFVQAPVSLTACSALAVASTAIQGLVDVRRSDKLEGPTGIYTLVLADSGERKTSSDGHFSKPIAQWETEKAEAAKPQVKKNIADYAVWEAKRNGLTSAISASSKAGKSTEALASQMNELENSKPEEPKVPRLLYADATPEALAYSLAHKWPVGAVISSEAGIVFGSHGMGRDSAMRNMSILNCFWDGAPVPIDRRTTTSYTVRNVRLTMGLAVQPETIRAFLDSSKGLARGIGFLARFLIAWPESTQGKRLFKEAPEAWPELGRFHRRVGALLDYPLTYDDKGYLSPVMLELSPKAKEAWVAFHDDVEAELNPGREMAEAKDVASKAADNAVRLAALFHVFEVGIEGQISVEHMSAGAAIAGWHLYEARRFLGELAVDVGTSNAVTLDGWIIGYCKANHVQEISRRHIQLYGPNCTRSKEKLTAAIKELVDAGRIRETKIGRQKTIEINPKLLED